MKKIKELWNKRKGFTLIELIVVMAIIGILVLLAAPRFLGQTDDAHETKHIANARTLEDASERYYMDHGDWPRLTDEPYTSDEVAEYAERVRDVAGEEVTLTDGNYYDLDYEALNQYAKLPDAGDRGNYILRNPAGKIYYLENLTEEGRERESQATNTLEEGQTIDFAFTGSGQEIELPAGSYQLEVWGAQGGTYNDTWHGGKGGYSVGRLHLDSEELLHVYVGGTSTGNPGGWNGGGNGNLDGGFGGGGATDVRLNSDTLKNRIIVAGGGGGGSYWSPYGGKGGHGGGLTSGNGHQSEYPTRSEYIAYGGTQTNGGQGTFDYFTSGNGTRSGIFGFGGRAMSTNGTASGGGGGWYGGASGYRRGSAGGGGSGYVLTETSHKPAGYTPTSEFYMTNAELIPGNQTMPNPNGGTMVGNSGHGFARITVIK